MTGEVSMVNDDSGNNKFLDSVGRFPEIEEDNEPYRLLASDYAQWIKSRRGSVSHGAAILMLSGGVE